MKRTSFAVFLAIVFVAALIATPFIGPTLMGMFAST